MKQTIHVIKLGVRDVTLSLAFYKNAFGWEVCRYMKEQQAVFFDLGQVYLLLYPREYMAGEMETEFFDADRPVPTVLTHVVETEEEVNAVIKKATEHGAVILKDPSYSQWGGYRAFIEDPDRHVWQVGTTTYLRLGEDGKPHLKGEAVTTGTLQTFFSFFSGKNKG